MAWERPYAYGGAHFSRQTSTVPAPRDCFPPTSHELSFALSAQEHPGVMEPLKQSLAFPLLMVMGHPGWGLASIPLLL